MAQDNWWESAPVVGQAPKPASAPKPLRGPAPKPEKPEKPDVTYRQMDAEEVKQRGLDSNNRWQISSNGAVSSLGPISGKGSKQNFEQEGKLRDDFNQSPQVKGYRNSLPMLSTALRAPKTGQGDLTVIYAYAKLMDPESVVREGEMDMVNSSSPFVQTTIQNLKGQLDSSGRLPPETRRRLDQEMIRTTQARRKAYEAQFNDYKTRAEQYGLDPMMVVGTHAGDAFRDDMMGYDKERGLGRFAEGANTVAPPVGGPNGTNSPTMRGGLPVGTQITFDGDGAGAPQWWDRNEWLMQTYGINPDQETQIAAFWNANRRNEGLTVDGARAWYQENGLPVPSDEGLAMEVARAKEGSFEYGAFDDSEAKAARQAELQALSDQSARMQGSVMGSEGFDPASAQSFGERLERAPLLGASDEVAGFGSAIGAALTGQNPVKAYRDTRDSVRLENDQMREKQGAAGTAIDIIGSLPTANAIPTGRGGLVGSVIRGRGVVADAVRGGVRAGAITGFNEGSGLEGSVKQGVVGGGIGGVMGGVLGKGGTMIADRAARAPVRPTTAQNMALGEKFGVDLSLGDAGNMSAKAVERLLDVQPGSAGVMNASRQAKSEQIVNAADNVAEMFGPTTSQRGLGEAAQTGAKGWIDRFERVSGKAYDAIPINAEAPAVTSGTVTRLGELTSKFSSNPKLAAQLKDKKLEGFLDALTEKARKVPTGLLDDAGNPIMREVTEGGGLSWKDLKDMRSRIGEEIGQQMFGEGTLKSDLRSLYAALSEDMKATAARSGPKALRTFERANTLYRQGQERIDGAITKLLGKDGMMNPEKTSTFIQSIAKGGKSNSDLAALKEVRATLKPDEWGQVQNGLIRLLGQPANSEGRDFAAQTFIRNFADMSNDAKNVVFGNGPLRKNLDEFAEVIGMVARNDGTRNVSNTAAGLAGLIGFGAGGYPALIMQAVTSYGAAKLWNSPIFIKWVTGLAKAGPKGSAAFKAQVDKLPRIIAANDNIAPEATELLNRINSFSNQSAAAAAPEDQKQDPRREPVGR